MEKNKIFKKLDDPEYLSVINSMVISYYNVAAEEEYFNNYDEAYINYDNACTLAKEYLGENHQTDI